MEILCVENNKVERYLLDENRRNSEMPNPSRKGTQNPCMRHHGISCREAQQAVMFLPPRVGTIEQLLLEFLTTNNADTTMT